MAFDSVILFNKSLEQRLSEFRSVLCSPDHSLSANNVADEWSNYSELVVEPAGWQAIWKVCRQTCGEFKIKFPTYVVVYVDSVNYKELSASVSAVSVQGNISIPEKHEVLLIDLYPEKEQENSALNIKATADCIDQLRFFYTNIWHPWDLDDGDDGDWPSMHLEPRLILHFEMMDKDNFPQKLANKIYNQVKKSHQLYERRKEIEAVIAEGELQGRDFDENILSPSTQTQGFELLKIHLELNPLKIELQLLENPTMRTLIISQFLQDEANNSKHIQYILVWQLGSLSQLDMFIQQSKCVVNPNATICSAPSLEAAMEIASSGQLLLLPSGVHKFSGRIEVAVNIQGVGCNNVYIKRDESNSYLLNIHARPVIMENITLDARNVEGAIIVPRNTELNLSNCKIIGENKRETVGILVLAGGSVHVNHCYFNDLHIAINCLAGSKVTIKDSFIHGCQDGLKAHDHVELAMEGGSITNSTNAGIVYAGKIVSNQVGDVGLLDVLKGVLMIKNVKLTDNSHDVQMQSLSS